MEADSSTRDPFRFFSTTDPMKFRSSTTNKPQPKTENTAGRKRREDVSESESEPQSKGEPRPEGEAQPESETTSEPKNEPEGGGSYSEPVAEPESWPEPGPLWKDAFLKWKYAWHIHVYLFATAFLLIGFYAGYYVVLNVYDGLRSKYLSVCLNAMVFLFGITRAFVLFLDPYHQGNLINALFTMRLLWSIGGPCLTASDSLIILALLETSKLTIAPPRFQKLRTITVVVGVHFVLVIVSDTVVSTYMEAKVMILLCQLFFSAWGTLLGTGYAVLAYKLDKKLFSHKTVKEKEDKIYIFLIYASAAANYFICGVMAYTMFSVFGVYSEITFVDAWHWWTLQTLFRIGEITTCVLIFTVSAKRTRVKNAMDEISEFDSVTQTFEISSRLNPFRKLRGCFELLRNRSNKVAETSVSVKDGEESNRTRNNNNVKRGSHAVSDNEDTLPPVFEAFQASGRGRRQSLFSRMHDASIENRIKATAAAMPVVPSRRKRRQSLFSAMHEASINNAISNFAQATRQAPHNDVICESLESDSEPCEEPASIPRRGRRANLFSTLEESTPDKKVVRKTAMEDITEESVMEDRDDQRTRKPPWPLLKKRSSDRLRQIIASFLPSKETEGPGNVGQLEEKEENKSENDDDLPVVSS